MAVGKQIQVKIYDREGILRTTLVEVTLSSFDWALNGGLGQLRLLFARPIDDFKEGTEIDLNFRVEVRVIDRETPPAGLLVYQGYIQSYRQIARGNQEQIEVICLGYQALFTSRLLKSSSSTTVTYTARDPSYIIKDAIEKMAGRITTTSSSVENTGLSIGYTFRANTIKEVLDKCVEISPNGFYWYTDANNVLYFAMVDYNLVDHTLIFKKDFQEIEIEKNIDLLTNQVYFVGGGNPNLFRRSVRSSSVSEWGTYEKRISDERVTTSATADQIATTDLDRFDHPIVRIRVKLIDSNIPGSPEAGFDIERFKPGQVLQIRNLVDDRATLWDQAQWDVDFWDYNFLGALANPFIITRITYEFNSVILELGEFQDIFGREYHTLEGRLQTSQFQNLPSSPTDV